MNNQIDATDEDLEHYHRSEISLAEVEAAISQRRERLERVHSRWNLSLAVANGGALTLLGGRVLELIGGDATNDARMAVAIVFPSLWFFTIGVIASGGASLNDLLQTRSAMRKELLLRNALRKLPTAKPFVDVSKPSLWKTARSWGWECLAGLMFCAGITYPTIILTAHYLSLGAFDW